MVAHTSWFPDVWGLQTHEIQKYYFLYHNSSSPLMLQAFIMLQYQVNIITIYRWCLMPRSVWSQQQHKCQSWYLGGMWVGQPFWFTKYSRPLPVHQYWTTITLDGLQLTGLSLWRVTVPILNLKLNLKCRVWELTGIGGESHSFPSGPSHPLAFKCSLLKWH